jgi:hypothetical protein
MARLEVVEVVVLVVLMVLVVVVVVVMVLVLVLVAAVFYRVLAVRINALKCSPARSLPFAALPHPAPSYIPVDSLHATTSSCSPVKALSGKAWQQVASIASKRKPQTSIMYLTAHLCLSGLLNDVCRAGRQPFGSGPVSQSK